MTAFLEAFPIFLRAPVDEGGLGLDSTDVGLIQAVAGAAGILIVSIGVLPMMAKRFTIPGTYWRNLTFSACCYLVPPALAAFSSNTPWLGLGLAIGGVALVNQMSYGTINIMIKNVASPELLGAAVGLGSSIGTCGMALGPIWGGSLFAYSSDPDAGLGILGNGRLFFATLSLLAIINSRLASRLPPWPREAGQDWRYEFFRCRRTSLQRLPAPCGAVA